MKYMPNDHEGEQGAAVRSARRDADLVRRPVRRALRRIRRLIDGWMSYVQELRQQHSEAFGLQYERRDPACGAGPTHACVLSGMQITLDHTLPIPIPYPTDLSMPANFLGNQRHMSHGTLLHNHPSGDPKPSRDDIETTRELKAAANALELELHDHVVIGHGNHASFRSLGLL
jgi:hypothetical protein